MDKKTKDLSLTGLLIALVCICTMFIAIPIPSGYIHLGDSMILFVGVVFGKKKGMIAGGIGSMLADILLGYLYYAPFTLIIKGAMGFIAGIIGYNINKNNSFLNVSRLIAGVVSGIIMVAGYFVTTIILTKGTLTEGLEEGFASILPNFIQASMGFVLYLVFGIAFFRIGLQNILISAEEK